MSPLEDRPAGAGAGVGGRRPERSGRLWEEPHRLGPQPQPGPGQHTSGLHRGLHDQQPPAVPAVCPAHQLGPILRDLPLHGQRPGVGHRRRELPLAAQRGQQQGPRLRRGRLLWAGVARQRPLLAGWGGSKTDCHIPLCPASVAEHSVSQWLFNVAESFLPFHVG